MIKIMGDWCIKMHFLSPCKNCGGIYIAMLDTFPERRVEAIKPLTWEMGTKGNVNIQGYCIYFPHTKTVYLSSRKRQKIPAKGLKRYSWVLLTLEKETLIFLPTPLFQFFKLSHSRMWMNWTESLLHVGQPNPIDANVTDLKKTILVFDRQGEEPLKKWKWNVATVRAFRIALIYT